MYFYIFINFYKFISFIYIYGFFWPPLPPSPQKDFFKGEYKIRYGKGVMLTKGIHAELDVMELDVT
jgi:hypothetical protein